MRILYLMLTILLIPLAKLYPQIVISEIMYNPDGPDYYTEYVEIYNAGDTAKSLRGYRISDGNDTDSLSYVSGDGDMEISPDEFALIIDSGYWENGDGRYDDFIPAGTLLLTIEDAALGSGGLSNSQSRTVSLLKSDSSIVSER